MDRDPTTYFLAGLPNAYDNWLLLDMFEVATVRAFTLIRDTRKKYNKTVNSLYGIPVSHPSSRAWHSSNTA